MKKLIVFICLALCMMLLACSCGGNTDTDTDTSKDTTSDSVVNSDTNTDTNDETPNDSDIITGDVYRAFVCDAEGNGLANIFVQYCKDTLCEFGYTDENGYINITSAEYHVALVIDESEVYENITYNESNYPVFEGDSKLITITLTKK